MSTEENKANFRRFVDQAPNAGNLAVIDELFDPSVVEYLPGRAEPVRGIAGVKGIVTGNRAAFPDLHVTIEAVIAEGDYVAARVTARGTNTGELMGMAPTGERVEWAVNHYCRFKDGKLIEDWINFDQLGFLQQLGIMPAG